MSSINGKIVFLLFASLLETKCCKRDDFQYIRITEKPKSVDNPYQLVSEFTLPFFKKHQVILPLEGLSPCRDNIQEYEKNLKHALVVHIRGHLITELRSRDVQNLENLDHLDLTENSIEVIEPGAFFNVPKLKYLYLYNNRIKTIPSGVFNNLLVNELDMHRNNIAHIAPDAFNNMSNLTVVNLNHNELKNWNSAFFTNTPNIYELRISSNELTKIPEGSFNGIKNTLKILQLSRNQIDDIDAAAFAELTKLRSLSLDYNKFDCLSDHLLAAFPGDLTLYIAPNNNIKCLCWNKIQEWSSEHYGSNKDTINSIVRHSDLRCHTEILEILANIEKRVSALENQSAFIQ